MAQKALVLSKLHMCFVCNHTNGIKTIQTYSQVQTLVGLVDNKIDNKIKLIITE